MCVCVWEAPRLNGGFFEDSRVNASSSITPFSTRIERQDSTAYVPDPEAPAMVERDVCGGLGRLSAVRA